MVEIPLNENRESSSSEEPMDTSDEVDKLDDLDINRQCKIDQFISDVHRHSHEETPDDMMQTSVVDKGRKRMDVDDPQLHCSRQAPPVGRSPAQQPVPQLMKAEEMIWDAETFRARIVDVPGRSTINEPNIELNERVFHSALLDEYYLLVGNYIDEKMKKRIGNGEYVDFAKLMPQDRVGIEDSHRMEMVNKNGMSYWVPVADRETTVINGYAKWEQAYCVFSNIYTHFHPSRAGKLIQYNHIIHTAAQSFIWENVYRYDREFRIHMNRYYSVRSWSIILQQAWSMCLKDKILWTPTSSSHNGNSQRSGGHNEDCVLIITVGIVHSGKNANLTIDVLFVINLVTEVLLVGKQPQHLQKEVLVTMRMQQEIRQCHG